jgi:hypothetical protein
MKNQKEFLQEKHPRIWARVEEIMKEQGEEWNIDLVRSFFFSETRKAGEGKFFWKEIYVGNYQVFYDRYPEQPEAAMHSAKDIYHKMRAIAEEHHDYDSQMVAIAKWVANEFTPKC